MTDVRLTAVVTGQVQGVGFRYWVRRHAEQLKLTGRASNETNGSVTVIAEGSAAALERLLALLRSGRSPGQVAEVSATYSSATGEFTRFRGR